MIVKLMNVTMLMALLVIMLYKFMMFLLMYGIRINIMIMKELGIFMLMQRQVGAKIALGTISKKRIRFHVVL